MTKQISLRLPLDLALWYESNAEINRANFIFEAMRKHIAGIDVEEGLKQCSRCKTFFPRACFGKDKTKKDGKSSRCRNCDTLQTYLMRDSKAPKVKLPELPKQEIK